MQHNFVPATALNLVDKSLANIHETQVAQFCILQIIEFETDDVENTFEFLLLGPGEVCSHERNAGVDQGM
jgi:hypothetical protein